MREERLVSPASTPEDEGGGSLRPTRLATFVGQETLKERLQIAIDAARERGEYLEHALFHGPPGLGKTTLAHIIAAEMSGKLVTTSGPALEKTADLMGILTNLEHGDVLFVDEIHRMSPVVEEYLYPALEDFTLDIMLDRGPSARSLKINLERFTLVGATTRSGLLSSPLRARFGVTMRLDYYRPEDLARIVTRSAGILKVTIDSDAAHEIARRSRGTPRVANRLLRRIRDYALIRAEGAVTLPVTRDALRMLEVDDRGLDEMDRRMLHALITKYHGGPVGLGTLAVVVGEEADTLEDVYEPYLIQEGFLKRTARGREATDLAFTHLGLTPPKRAALADPESPQSTLF